MSGSHEYILLQKPNALTTEELESALERLIDFWGSRANGLPHERLHWRWNLVRDAVIMDGIVDTDVMTANATAKELAELLSKNENSLRGQLNTAINRFRAGENNKRASKQDALEYIQQNLSAWELPNP